MIARVQGVAAAEEAPPPLLPLLGAHDEMDTTFERLVQPIAERARAGDQVARDALYKAFEPKVKRFARSIRDARCDPEDVEQEGYLVFLGVVERWNPAIPFGRYFLAHFRWRLRDAVYRGIGRRGIPPRSTVVAIDATPWEDMLPDTRALDAQERALIEALASSFRYPEDVIVRYRILEGLSVEATAERIGVNRRTITRHWNSILQSLRV